MPQKINQDGNFSSYLRMAGSSENFRNNSIRPIAHAAIHRARPAAHALNNRLTPEST